jgi:hypothetical protein
MKRIIFSILASCFSAFAFAQFSITGAKVVGVEQENIDSVFVIDDAAEAKLTYQDSEARTFNWYSYALGAEEETLLHTDTDVLETTIPLVTDPSVGYHLVAEGMPDKWVWVFQYQAFPLSFQSVKVHDNLEDRCTSYQIELQWDALPLQYDTLQHNKVPFEVERMIRLTYDSTYYAEGSYLVKTVTDSIPLATDIVVASP